MAKALVTFASHQPSTEAGQAHTATELVDCLLDSALDPVLDQAAHKANPEDAILDLKVCDPACGSGHFLVASARRIAKRLAVVRAGEEEPSPKDVQHALRDVVGRCIYGVDVNPMAVELCKVSLWMEAIEPGRPLSFLDSHIQCGNALLGATPALMTRGIPDDAFRPLEGDDTDVAKRLKRRNADEIKGQTTIFTLLANDRAATRECVVTLAAGVEDVADRDIELVREKERRWGHMSRSAEFRDAWFRADSWCSAFLWPKQEGALENAAITHEVWRRISRDVTEAPKIARQTIREIARRHRFFHWHLAFPHVFHSLKPELTDADVTGWIGGFDVVIGNPPWEAADLMKVEFFSVLLPEVITATTSADRENIIEAAVRSNPELGVAWATAQRTSQGERHLATKSGLFPQTSGGKYNTYRTFAELGTMLIVGDGRSGLILKSGIINAQANQDFFAGLLLGGRVVGANDFINTAQLFPSVVGNERFCTLTVCGPDATVDRAVFRFGLTDPAQMKEEGRVLRLGAREVRIVNPNDNSVPPVTSPRDLRLLLGIHEKLGILNNVATKQNPHRARYKRGHLNSSTYSGLFKEHTFEMLNGAIATSRSGWTSSFVPLIEGKLIATFNHRFGSFRDVPPTQRFGKKAQPARSRAEQLLDPEYRPLPRFWIASQDHEELARKAKTASGWVLAFRHVCRAIVDARTAQFCIAPCETFSDSCAFVLFKAPGPDAAQSAAIVCASLTSFVGDYVLRQKIYGPALTKAILLQLPAPSKGAVSEWPGLGDGLNFLTERVLELTYTSWSLAEYAADLGYFGPPFRWDEERRFLLRCELDAAFFHLYGIERDDADYIMETFPIVKRKEIDEYGEFSSKVRVLELYDRMKKAIDCGRTYETIMDPPPADHSVGHPQKDDAR